MNVLVILACVAMVAARPEPPVGGYSHQHGGGGYNYQPHGGHGHAGGGAHGGAHGGGHGGYNYQQPAFGSINQFSGSAASASAGSAATAFDTSALGGGSSAFSGAAANTQSFGGAFSGANAQSASFAAAAPTQQIVQKHIYVHVPPPEPELSFQQTITAPALRQKHYKIIFIKTPSAPSQAAQLALAQSQTEEKTIVYVLVKKPEQLGDITLPSPAIAKPSKPEVYFIKYKTNSEGGNAAFANAGAVASAGSAATGPGGLGLLSSSGVASSSASAGAHASSAGHAHSPANTYGAPGGGSHGGYH